MASPEAWGEPRSRAQFRYDPLGRLVYAREGAHVTERSYDVRGVTAVHVSGAGHVDARWSVANPTGSGTMRRGVLGS